MVDVKTKPKKLGLKDVKRKIDSTADKKTSLPISQKPPLKAKPKVDRARQKKNRAEREKVFGQLHAHWPALFNPQRKPLAVGIWDQLVSDLNQKGEPIDWLKNAIRQWCRSDKYLKHIARGGPRYGFGGEQGEVTEDQQHSAKLFLKKRKSSVKNPIPNGTGSGKTTETKQDSQATG